MELVRTLENLPTVKISLSFGGDAGDGYSAAVGFEVGLGAEVWHRFTVSPAELGIPPGFDPGNYRRREPEFSLTEETRSELADPGLAALGGERTLWLQLASPIGYLAGLPWERMLEPVFPHIPILRIPDFTLVPERGEGPVDIVVCISEPDIAPQPAAARLLSQFLADGSMAARLDATVHVFTDLPTYHLLSGRFAAAPRLRLYDPQAAGDPLASRTAARQPPGTRQPRGSGAAVTNPWLSWLVQEMRGSTVEAVHFVTHGYVADEQPCIALSDSPTTHDERLWARFISPDQVAACLTQLGAWSVGFSSLPGNFSPLGLREFADSVARLRPGPVLYHQPGADPDEQLDLAYGGLFTGRRAPLSPDSFLYVHPRTMGVEGPSAYAESLVAETLGRESRPQVAPPWETATRRFLEQTTAQIFPEQTGPISAEQEAVGDGVREALAFVNQVLQEHGGQRQ